VLGKVTNQNLVFQLFFTCGVIYSSAAGTKVSYEWCWTLYFAFIAYCYFRVAVM